MTEDEFRQVLSAEGFATVVLVTYEANGGQALHEHPFEAKALIVSGDLEIDTDGETTRYGVGDVFHLRHAQPHVERYGPAGVSYLVGRR
jgi:quercetin dioxygenase-like cupin family protein